MNTQYETQPAYKSGYDEAALNAAKHDFEVEERRALARLRSSGQPYINYPLPEDVPWYDPQPAMNAPMPDTGYWSAEPTGLPLPEALIEAVLAADIVALLKVLAEYPHGVINDRINALPQAPTLLHIAAAAYAKTARKDGRMAAEKYDTVVSILLRRGADPELAAFRPSDSSMPETPAAFCDGCQPPALHDRMMRDAAENRVGWKPEFAIHGVRAPSQATKARLLRADSRRSRSATAEVRS